MLAHDTPPYFNSLIVSHFMQLLDVVYNLRFLKPSETYVSLTARLEKVLRKWLICYQVLFYMATFDNEKTVYALFVDYH